MISSNQRNGEPEGFNLQTLSTKVSEGLKDIEALDEEVGFFKDVFQRYFSEPAPETGYRTREIQRNLYDLNVRKHVVRSELLNHSEVLTLVTKGLITRDEEKLREQNSSLEARLEALNRSFRKCKSEIFDFIAD